MNKKKTEERTKRTIINWNTFVRYKPDKCTYKNWLQLTALLCVQRDVSVVFHMDNKRSGPALTDRMQ